jgi:hypothetical protein
MVRIKEMPYSEKYAKVIDTMKFGELSVFPFVQKHLGDQAVSELKGVIQSGSKPIPEAVSFKEKYEVAYGNWIWGAKNIFLFIRRQMGEDGLKKFERADVEALIKKNATPTLTLLKIIRLFSPSTAFTMTAKQMGYQLQWLSPFSVTELTRHKAVFDIPRCKILDFADIDDICVIGCQSVYPMWVAEQFKLDMKFNRQGNSCTGILAHLR